jgi:ABC-2 type transport system ATP-binding protein
LITFPSANRFITQDDYNIYFSTDIGVTVAAIIHYIQEHDDVIVDLRVERPSLEDRFLELTNTGGEA